MHPLVKRYINVSIDGIVQGAVLALAVAIAGGIMTTAVILFGHVRGVWLDRMLGVIVGIVFVPLAVFLLRFVRIKRTSKSALLEIPKGFMDYKIDVETAMASLPAITNRLTAVMGEVGPMMGRHTSRLQQSSSTAEQLKVGASVSSSLDRFSARMRRLQVKYVQKGESLSGGLNGWFKWIEQVKPSKSQLASFPEALAEFNGVLNRSNDQQRSYIAVMENAKGASRVMDAAIQQAHSADQDHFGYEREDSGGMR
jgi:hypothetical protein